MNTNAGRNMVINEDNKWYYFAYVINGCDIDCDDIHEAIENLENHVKSIYSNDISNFEHMSEYDGLDACSLLRVINSNEIRQGVTQGDLSTMYFICDTDAIKGYKLLYNFFKNTMYFRCDTDAIKGGEN